MKRVMDFIVKHFRNYKLHHCVLSRLFQTKLQGFNSYVCIFVSPWIRIPMDKQLFRKVMWVICRKVDAVSNLAKSSAMGTLVRILYSDASIISEARSRRRKILKLSSYITNRESLKFFLQYIGLSTLRRKGRDDKFYQSFEDKWLKYHNLL
jgi:hypothetical protein